MSTYQRYSTLNTIFTNFLTDMIEALQNRKLDEAWKGPNLCLTALTYDVFEKGFIIFTAWIQSLSAATFAEAMVHDPFGRPTAPILLVNPSMSSIDDTKTVLDELWIWKQKNIPRITDGYYADNMAHAATPIRNGIFRSAAAPAPPGPKPALGMPPAGTPSGNPIPSYYPAGYDQFQFSQQFPASEQGPSLGWWSTASKETR